MEALFKGGLTQPLFGASSQGVRDKVALILSLQVQP
jgi:hypothetical protein